MKVASNITANFETCNSALAKAICERSQDERSQDERNPLGVLITVIPLPQQTVIAGWIASKICQKSSISAKALLMPMHKGYPDIEKIYGAFGVAVETVENVPESSFPVLLAKKIVAVVQAYWLIMFFGVKDFCEKFSIEKIPVGDLIYDLYIRADCRFLSPRIHLLTLAAMVCRVVNYAVKTRVLLNGIKYVVISETFYSNFEAILHRAALLRGVPSIHVSYNFVKVFKERSQLTEDRFKVNKEDIAKLKEREACILSAQSHLQQRLNGEIPHHDVKNAYLGKMLPTRGEFFAKHGILQSFYNRRIVFVAPPCFSDSNHKCGNLIFGDNYEWLCFTLRNLPMLDEFIYVIREHPSAHLYNETGVVAAAVAELRDRPDIVMMKSGLSTRFVFQNAHAILTVNGTIGLEAALLGIPVILGGESSYSRHGFTIEPSCPDDYLVKLKQLPSLTRLSNDQVVTAALVYYVYFIVNKPRSSILPSDPIAPGLSIYDHKSSYEEKVCKILTGLKSLNFSDDPFFSKIESDLSRAGVFL